MKYEKTIAEYTIKADDISLYPQKAMPERITYGGSDQAEHKYLPIKLRLVQTRSTEGMKDRPPQVVLELCGEYHVEELVYHSTKPDDWCSYGKIWLSKDEVEALVARLQSILKGMR